MKLGAGPDCNVGAAYLVFIGFDIIKRAFGTIN